MPDLSRTNDVRTVIVESATGEMQQPVPVHNGVIALALVYLGDSIREGTSDIGPALEKLAEKLSIETGGVASALSDLASEVAHLDTSTSTD